MMQLDWANPKSASQERLDQKKSEARSEVRRGQMGTIQFFLATDRAVFICMVGCDKRGNR